MEFLDRTLTCVDCGVDFLFSAGEQAFFHEKQFKNDPRHCKPCNAKRAHRALRPRVEVRVTCADCGVDTTVPFKPKNGRPVLCRLCFTRARQIPASPELEPLLCP